MDFLSKSLKAENVTHSYNVGSNACACHAPGQLHRTDFKVNGEDVAVQHDVINGTFLVAFSGHDAAINVSEAEALAIMAAHFNGKVNLLDW